jgi:hypothetical protein
MPMKKGTKVLGASPAEKMERAAIANRDPARAKAAMQVLKKEGTTYNLGGRAPTKGKMK